MYSADIMGGICTSFGDVLQGGYADETKYFFGRYGGRTSFEVGLLNLRLGNSLAEEEE